jgi:hypothetical protein
MPTVGVNRKVDAGTEFAVQMLVGARRLLARGAGARRTRRSMRGASRSSPQGSSVAASRGQTSRLRQ